MNIEQTEADRIANLRRQHSRRAAGTMADRRTKRNKDRQAQKRHAIKESREN